MALLNKAAWRSWHGMYSRYTSNYIALKEFIKSGATIQEIAVAGKQCKTKYGRNYTAYGIYGVWLSSQRELHSPYWLPSLEVLLEWCQVLNLPKTQAHRWLKECQSEVASCAVT
jgi:hypothetical protein